MQHSDCLPQKLSQRTAHGSPSAQEGGATSRCRMSHTPPRASGLGREGGCAQWREGRLEGTET